MLEAANWLTGSHPTETTASGECLALMMSARRDAQKSTDDSLSAPTVDLASTLNSGFHGTSYEDLFAYVQQLEEIAPFVADLRGIVDAQVFGSLAENASRRTDEDGKTQSSRFLNRSISAIKKIAVTTPPEKLNEVILNDPDLAWVRTTDEFQQAWTEISDANQAHDVSK